MCSNLDRDLEHTLTDNDYDYDDDEFDCSNSCYASDEDCNYVDDDADDIMNSAPIKEVDSTKSYLILKEDDLIQRQQDEINKVTSVLSVSNDHACMLLLKYNWRVTRIHEAWFEDEVKVRESVGLLDVDDDLKFPKDSKKKARCGICFSSVKVRNTANCGCRHVFCRTCWKSYVKTAINDGPGCMTLKCPEPSCHAAVSPSMVNVLVDGKEKKKYDMFWFRSYAESNNKKIKWCPGPGCDYAVEFDDDDDRIEEDYNVTCDCKYAFCWKCTEDAHTPLDCETVNKWALQSKDESGSATWILAYTKPCPKCNKPIEKNRGCMHMTCAPPCRHEFCWLCLAPYTGSSLHFSGTCNAYRSEGGELISPSERRRESARETLQRYAHYYERWDANEKSRKQALLDFNKVETEYLKKLSTDYDMPEEKLQFVTDAWLQIVECRRVLKWSYAYGFYIPEKEKKKQTFFEFLQGEAEVGLERLHLCAEQELQIYIEKEDAEATTKVIFNGFRMKLTNLTNVTRSYFQNLVRALENGLSEVGCK